MALQRGRGAGIERQTDAQATRPRRRRTAPPRHSARTASRCAGLVLAASPSQPSSGSRPSSSLTRRTPLAMTVERLPSDKRRARPLSAARSLGSSEMLILAVRPARDPSFFTMPIVRPWEHSAVAPCAPDHRRRSGGGERHANPPPSGAASARKPWAWCGPTLRRPAAWLRRGQQDHPGPAEPQARPSSEGRGARGGICRSGSRLRMGVVSRCADPGALPPAPRTRRALRVGYAPHGVRDGV